MMSMLLEKEMDEKIYITTTEFFDDSDVGVGACCVFYYHSSNR